MNLQVCVQHAVVFTAAIPQVAGEKLPPPVQLVSYKYKDTAAAEPPRHYLNTRKRHSRDLES